MGAGSGREASHLPGRHLSWQSVVGCTVLARRILEFLSTARGVTVQGVWLRVRQSQMGHGCPDTAQHLVGEDDRFFSMVHAGL